MLVFVYGIFRVKNNDPRGVLDTPGVALVAKAVTTSGYMYDFGSYPRCRFYEGSAAMDHGLVVGDLLSVDPDCPWWRSTQDMEAAAGYVVVPVAVTDANLNRYHAVAFQSLPKYIQEEDKIKSGDWLEQDLNATK